MGRIYQIYGQDAHDMTVRLLEAADAVRFAPPGGTVALKPNLVVSGSAENGSVTHAGVLSGCVEYFREHGVSDVCIMESSWVGEDTLRAMRAAGYDEVCRRYGVHFYDLKRDETRSIKTPAGTIEVCRRALEAGLMVDLPVLKGHCQTAMTCALKNLKGCLPDREKRRFHAMGLHRPIAALAAVLKPRLVVVDSICGDLDFEEGGTPVKTNRMFLGSDPVQVDAYGCALMGLETEEVAYIGLAERFGAGHAQWSPQEVEELNSPCEAAKYPRPSGTVAALSCGIHENQACSACFAALVRALHAFGRGHTDEIYIGQGFYGQELDGLGVGSCCAGARVCIPGCPPTAQAIVRQLETWGR